MSAEDLLLTILVNWFQFHTNLPPDDIEELEFLLELGDDDVADICHAIKGVTNPHTKAHRMVKVLKQSNYFGDNDPPLDSLPTRS